MQMPATLSRILDGKLRNARKAARVRVKEAHKLLKRAKSAVSEAARDEVLGEATALLRAREDDDLGGMQKHGEKLSTLLGKHLSAYRKPPWRESFESIAWAVLVALLLRSFVVEAFKIPSGSMIPTLAIGDQIFVNKYIYGVRVPFTSIRVVEFARPKHGEVVVFMVPREPREDYIKRVIGLPGDEILIKRGQIFLNGKPVLREAKGKVTEVDRDGVSGPWHTFDAYAFEETLGEHTYTVLQDSNVSTGHGDYGPVIVPEDHIFVMGDNRDHSFDSRSWGTVPMENVLGRSLFVWWSWGKDGLSWDRLGTWID